MLALLDSSNKVNAIHLNFIKKINLPIRSINVGAQKTNGTILDNNGIVFAAFLITDKANEVKFLEKTFLVADVSLKKVFGISFLIFNNANINFLGQKLR